MAFLIKARTLSRAVFFWQGSAAPAGGEREYTTLSKGMQPPGAKKIEAIARAIIPSNLIPEKKATSGNDG
jgi:hypothetical protein